jgi:hypothetical protein
VARIKPESAPLPVRRGRLFGISPRALVALLLLVGCGLGAHFLWRGNIGRVAREARYQLTVENIRITPPPAWIRTDIKAEVLRDAGLAGTMSVLDDWPTLSRRVKEAFEFHPWVASVVKIERQLPQMLNVVLIYRRPVAAVESSDVSGVAFLPIDKDAIRLPERDLSDAERRYLPRVAGITGRPLVGDKWDDPRVVGGAKLAAALADVWQQLRLVEILGTVPTNTHDPQACSFELVTAGGTRIIWGGAPGEPSSRGESTFEQKRKRVMDYATQHGQLESIDGPEKLDVRSELVVTPRTARHKAAAGEKNDTKTK